MRRSLQRGGRVATTALCRAVLQQSNGDDAEERPSLFFGLDHRLGYVQLGCDLAVAVALGYEFQHVAFACGEGCERAAAAAHQGAHHVRIEDCIAVDYAFDGAREVLDGSDPFLEQVAHRAGES